MKTFTLVAFTALFSINVLQAQTRLNMPLQKQLHKALNSIAPGLKQLVPYGANYKAQSRSTQLSRLIATSYYDYISESYQFVDSNQFTYTGSNGGDYFDYELQTLKYTTDSEYYFDLGTGELGNDTLSRQTFDANDNIDSVIDQVFNPVTVQWQNLDEAYLGYDANNNDTLVINYEWDTLNKKWIPLSKVQNYYAGNFNDSEVIKIYDTTTSKFNNYLQFFETFTDTDTTSVFQEWTGVRWENLERAIYSDTSEIVQEYSSNKWINEEKETFPPIVNGTQLYYEFEWESNTWDTIGEEITYYDSNLNDTADLILNDNNGAWTFASKDTSQYNSYNQITSYHQFDYSTADSEFVPDNEDFYYYQIYTGINQLSPTDNQLSIFPNPTSDEVTVVDSKNINNLRVTNLLGQLVYESYPGQTQSTFELKDAGMYFVTVTTNNQITTSKVIVNK